jgi:8-oxo-dGTP pyrophosphatase MutT (NUDIX family)
MDPEPIMNDALQTAPAKSIHDLAAEEFFARARARLTLAVPAGVSDPDYVPRAGDHELDPVMAAIAAVRPIKPAAVLVPVVERAEPMVLLTQRTAHLKNHAGQISFPGGKIEPTDADPLAAALRETDEEIALEGRFIEPIGYLDLYLSAFGFRIVPTLARVQPGFTLRLNPDEVDDVFEVPLAFLMAPENHQTHTRPWQGMMRTHYAMPFGERYIWGATAGILRNLWERVYKA